MYKSKIGLFGGSFDPIHVGHVEIARLAVNEIPLDTLIVMPAGKAPHKHGSVFTDELRLNMTRVAMEELHDSRIIVSDWEIQQAQVNGKTSYTVDTMRYLQSLYPDAELYLILGTDMFNSLSTWKDPEKIVAGMKVVLVNRVEKREARSEKRDWRAGGYKSVEEIHSTQSQDNSCGSTSLASRFSPLASYIPSLVLSCSPPAVSSTEIRRRLESGESVDGLVPQKALELLQIHKPRNSQ